jgi:hypothetical protein
MHHISLPLCPQVTGQGWSCEEVFAGEEDLKALAARTRLVTVVVFVLAPGGGAGGEGGGSHAHLEKLVWHLLGQKKVWRGYWVVGGPDSRWGQWRGMRRVPAGAAGCAWCGAQLCWEGVGQLLQVIP